MSQDAHWIVTHTGVGIKVFPRCGSTTMLRTYGYGQSLKRFLACENQVVVVRHPFQRLLSVLSMFVNPNKEWYMETRGYPQIESLDDLMRFAVSMPVDELDLHLRPMTSQLEGWIPPTIYSLAAFIDEPPFGLAPVLRHDHKSYPRTSLAYDYDAYQAWKTAFAADFELWDSAKKAPYERGQ